MAKPMIYGLFPVSDWEGVLAGWSVIERDDTEALFEDDFDACTNLVKAYALLHKTAEPNIGIFAPAVGVLLLNDPGGNNQVYSYIDNLPEVRESCPSWVHVVPTFVVEAFDYAEGE